MDSALGECLRINKYYLKEVEIYQSAFAGLSQRQYSAPALIQALETNYNVLQIRFKPLVPSSGLQTEDPLDPNTAKSLQRLLKLINAGRGYLERDPTNAAEAVAVLGQVSDDLDCVYSHMCENSFGRRHEPLADAKPNVVLNGRKRNARYR